MRSTFAPFMTADIPDELAPALIGMLIVLAITVLGMFLIIALRFKKCPSDKIMVI